jgi:hypothetical protein
MTAGNITSITYEQLRRSGEVPRLHGNGFIQLNLAGTNERLHIWPDDGVKAQSVSTPIHDHVYSFKSRILLGTLSHLVYRTSFSNNGAYRLYQAEPRAQEDTILVPISGSRCNLILEEEHVLEQGDAYSFKAFEFHESRGSGLTATVMRKTVVFDGKARVVCPADKNPDNDFNRYSVDQNLLWTYIKKVFDKIGAINPRNQT